jgi:hypothetical protein
LLSRRGFLTGTSAAAAATLLASLKPRMAIAGSQAKQSGWLPFKPVAANTLDTVTLPDGFQWQVVARWGDPLWSRGQAFDPRTGGTAASQALAFGDNNDGMALFKTKQGQTILAVNNEYANLETLYPNRPSRRPQNADDIAKSKAGHGVSIVEITQVEGQWQIVKDSPFNRRITADSPMEITGPARGHALLKTADDPTGTSSLGTWNNCACGETPWGTYLACEENFHMYFSSNDPNHTPAADHARYGIGPRDFGFAWASEDPRFDISQHPQEPYRAGYVVEIDPFDPQSKPKKRTALGRFSHENAAVTVADDGRVVVYLGDDAPGEFLYRFVSSGKYKEGADHRNLLEDGQLYAAKFHEEGHGEWLELTPESTGLASQAEICIRTRQAASAVQATTMDRPEWVAVHPHSPEVYCSLTNNPYRGRAPNAGGDATPVNGPNPRETNLYGQIVRWWPQDGDHTASEFEWDLYAMAGNPKVHTDHNAGSDNITIDNMFNAPDGLAFDSKGGLWIQTDGNTSNSRYFEGQGNNQMLFGDPESGEIRRFLVGPRGCEITGVCWSTDKSTLFVGIQHPGAGGSGHFPDGDTSMPRSCVIAVQRDDGGPMG